MSQVPLTEDGVAKKQAELYALDQQELNNQSNLVRNDFTGWIMSNFSLTDDEQTSLKDMSVEVVLFISVQVAASIQVKQPIHFKKENKSGDRSSKRFRIEKSVKVIITPNNPPIPEGSLIIDIFYVIP